MIATSTPRTATYDSVDEGSELPEVRSRIRRADLIRYCGASGDFNVIHWNERAALDAGLPDVIAHGMLTMAVAARIVTDWVGDPGAVAEYAVRFSRPVVVPDDEDGAELVVTARVAKKLPDHRVRVDIVVRSGADKVLSMARAVVALA
ncbi:MAG: MaoC/PaaZ C-terminal domain-containing protein [Geodermatophilaceae bacterium]|jgi:acyl dehydratase